MKDFWECLNCRHKWKSAKTFNQWKKYSKKTLIDNKYVIHNWSKYKSNWKLNHHEYLTYDYNYASRHNRMILYNACKY